MYLYNTVQKISYFLQVADYESGLLSEKVGPSVLLFLVCPTVRFFLELDTSPKNYTVESLCRL